MSYALVNESIGLEIMFVNLKVNKRQLSNLAIGYKNEARHGKLINVLLIGF